MSLLYSPKLGTKRFKKRIMQKQTKWVKYLGLLGGLFAGVSLIITGQTVEGVGLIAASLTSPTGLFTTSTAN